MTQSFALGLDSTTGRRIRVGLAGYFMLLLSLRRSMTQTSCLVNLLEAIYSTRQQLVNNVVYRLPSKFPESVEHLLAVLGGRPLHHTKKKSTRKKHSEEK